MSAREGAAGQIRVGTALGLEGVVLCVAGVVSGMSLPRVEKVGPTIRVPQGHGVIRGVAGHRVVVTSTAGQAFHCHRGRVDMHIQLLPQEVCTGPKTSSTKKNTTMQKHRQTNKKKETEKRIINITYLHTLKTQCNVCICFNLKKLLWGTLLQMRKLDDGDGTWAFYFRPSKLQEGESLNIAAT